MSGGMCEIATEQAEADGVPLAKLSDATIARLRDALPPMASPANPLDLTGAAMLEPELIVKAISDDGKTTEFKVICRIDTPAELDYYRHGGILEYVLRQLLQN